MGYNQKTYARIKQEYETKYLRAQEAADLRRAEVLLVIPEMEEIDRKLAETGLELMNIAMSGGDVQKGIDAARRKNFLLQERKRDLLVMNHFPVDYTEIKYECPICNDSGYVDLKMCSCMRKKLIQASYESSGMADLLQIQSFDNFDLSFYSDNPTHYAYMTKLYDLVKSCAHSFEPEKPVNMIFVGGTGLGKTHLSTSIAKVVIDNGFDVFYASSLSMYADFEMQRFGNSSGSETGLGTSQYFECDLLIIDDLGSEIINQFSTSTLYNIINTRINRKKSTIINTNFTQEELKQKYWDRITSRIFGEYRVIPFVGQDIRQKKIKRSR